MLINARTCIHLKSNFMEHLWSADLTAQYKCSLMHAGPIQSSNNLCNNRDFREKRNNTTSNNVKEKKNPFLYNKSIVTSEIVLEQKC